MVTGSEGDTKIWEFETLKLICSFEGARGLLSPDGKLIAGIVPDPLTKRVADSVRFWEVFSKKEIATINCSSGVWSFAFSPKNDILVTGNDILVTGNNNKAGLMEPGEAQFWHIRSGKKIMSIKGHLGPFCVVAFSPDGKLIATGSLDKKVILWDVEKGLIIKILQMDEDQVFCLSFSPDGKKLACSSKRSITIWEIANKKLLINLSHAKYCDEKYIYFFYHPSRNVIASCSGKTRYIDLWDINTGKILISLRNTCRSFNIIGVDSISFTPNGKKLAVAVFGEIELIDVPE